MAGIGEWRSRFSTVWDDFEEGFRHHAAAFALVIALLLVIDIATGAPYWVHWVVLGWGAGLGLHYWLAHVR